MSFQFFVANNGTDGQELWVTDGTASGTFELKDINPGAGSANIGNQVQSNGIMYFTAYDGSSYHLWRSDGTVAGTYVLTSPTNGDNSGALTNVNGRLFFTGSDSVHGTGLFVTDGTMAGTQFVGAVSNAAQFSAVGDTLFFISSTPASGTELWKSDGTASGTALVKDILPGTGSGGYSNFTALGGKLYFTADDGAHGSEVWVSDGTAAGTVLLKDINSGSSSSGARDFFAASGHVFFTANDGAHGDQLWVTDGTSGNTKVLTLVGGQSPIARAGSQVVYNHIFYYVGTDSTGGSAIFTSNGTTLTKLVHLDSFAGTFYNLGSKLIFNGNDGAHGDGLYTFDGTSLVFVSAVSGGFNQPVVSNGHLYFVSYDAAHGNELWVSDGTAAGTHITADINTGSYDGQISNISAVGGGVAFSAYRPDVGTEVFFSDGTPSGTGLLANANPTGNHSPSLSISGSIVQAGTLGFFAADDGVHGSELWATDGTPGGSHLVADLLFGGSGSNPSNFHAVGNTIFYTADDGVNGRQLYTSNGSTVTKLTSGGLNQPYDDTSRFFTLGGKLYFMAYDPNGGWNIVQSNGTVAGTTIVTHFSYDTPLRVGATEILRGDDGTHGTGLYSFDGTHAPTFIGTISDYEEPVVSGGNLFFRSSDGSSGSELWVTNGTTMGLVKDLNPGSYSSTPTNIVGLGNGSVVFTAYNPATGNEVYVSDGTAQGTSLLKDLNATGNHGQSLGFNTPFYTAGTLTFFAGDDGIHGNELWVSDATAGGSHMVTDLVVGGSGSNPSNFHAVGNTIFYTADDGVNGRQLYTSNGSTVTKLTSGGLNRPYDDTSRFFTLGGKLYFMAYDPNGGWNIVQSNGTVAGTTIVTHFSYDTPLRVGATEILRGDDGTHGTGLYSFDGTHAPTFIGTISDYEEPVVSGGNLFFRSSDGSSGSELWVTNGTTMGLVKDLNPGSYSSTPTNIVGLGNGSVVFTAYNPATGNEVYVSDGTAQGTSLLKDLNATGNHGQSLNFNSSLYAAGTNTFFSADDGIHGSELWVSNGSTVGSHLVSDVIVGASGSNPGNFHVVGNKIIFLASDATGDRELYTSDGVTLTKLTSANVNQPYDLADRFFTLGSKLYYMSYGMNGQTSLAVTDGTMGGTQLVANMSFDTPIALGAAIILHGNDSTNGTGLYRFDGAGAPIFLTSVGSYDYQAVSGSNLFFRSTDGGDGQELWVTNGTAGAGTHEVKDINPGGSWSSPDQITSLGNGSIVFTADDGTNGRELWTSNGTSTGTIMLADLFPGGSSNPTGLIQVGSKVFFTANYFSSVDGAHGVELFVTDGTSNGTKLVHEFTPGSGSTSFDHFFSFNSKLYFTAYDNGWHLYVTDGSDVGTQMISAGDASSIGDAGNFLKADATHFFFTGDSGLFYSDGTNAGTVNIGSSRGYDANEATYSNGHLLFKLYDDTNGNELWTSDGTALGTQRVTDTLIPNSSNASNFTFSGGKVYFTADDGVHGNAELFVTDGTTSGTHILHDFNGASGTSFGAFFSMGGTFYFTAYENGWHLYATDGTDAGTHVITPGDSSSIGYAGSFLKADATHFFFTGDSGLFYSDGTNAGTVNIGSSRGYDANEATYSNGHLLFKLYDDTNGNELWTSDGTDLGTQRVTDTLIPNSSNASNFTFSGGKVYFTADDGVHGNAELFVTDGTTSGTHILHDFNGASGTSFGAFFSMGGTFYFTAYENGWHLYATDGTDAGTHVITPGDSSSIGYAGSFLKADATHFFFTGDSGLFYSDGTNAGTVNIGDTRGFDHPTIVNGILYYSHYDDSNGTELWKSDGTISGTTRLTDTQIPNSSNPASFAAVDNSPPTVANAGPSAITDQQTTHAFQNVVIGDTDLPTQTLTVTITPDDPTKGGFTAASLAASGFVAGGVAGSYTFVGTNTQATAAVEALVYQPTANRLVVGNSETIAFTIAVNDGAGGSVVNHQSLVTQTSANDAPVTVNESVVVNEDVTVLATSRAAGVLGNDSDVDVGETATIKVTNAHAGATADTPVAATGTTTIHGTYGDLQIAANGTYSYTPNTPAAEALTQGQAASDVFTYTASDVHGASSAATLTFNITGQEDGPVAVADARAVNEDATSSASTRAGGLLGNDTDADSGETATLKITGAHFGSGADAVVAATGTTTIHGTYGDLIVAADGTYSYTANTAAAEALPQGQAASDVFNYTITDVQGVSSASTVTFNITGQDDAPVATADVSTVNEDATATATTRATGVLSNDTDVDSGETATLKITGAHFGSAADAVVAATGTTTIHGTYGDLLIAANGTYSYTPGTGAAEALTQGQAATDVFSYTVADVQGQAVASTLTFNITGQEDGPVAVADARAVNEDATSSASTRAGGLLGNDTDADSGETATLKITGAHFGSGADAVVAATGTTTIHGTYGDLIVAADGTYSYTANTAAAEALPQGQAASDVFNYTITDVQGVSSASTVTFNITGQDDAPVATADVSTVNEDATATATTRATGVLSNDTDVDSGETATLKITGAHFGSAADAVVAATGTTTIHGTYGDLLIAANGTYSYTPGTGAAEALTQGQAATDVFSYTVADVQGQAVASTLTFNITGQEDGPVAVADARAVNEDATSSASTRAGGLLGNDTDADSGETATLKITGAHFGSGADAVVAATGTTTIHGTYGDLIVAADGTYSYTANTAAAEALPQGQAASDVFNYTITDVQGVSSASTVTFNITGQDDAPVAVNDSNGVVANQTISGASVLGNDYDVDGPALNIGAVNGSASLVGSQITLASGALLLVRPDGTYDYNPNHAFDSLTATTGAANSSAIDTFSYSLVGGNTATVTINVSGNPASTAPAQGTAGNDMLTGTSGSDLFLLQGGGDDHAVGGGGNDGFYVGAAWSPGDVLDGGAGSLDQIGVQGDYSAGLTLGASSMTGIEMLVFLPGSDTRFGDMSGAHYDYNITTNDGNVAAGQQLIVQANTLQVGESLTFNGSAETDGSFFFYGGSGTDHLTGGQQSDAFYFGVGRFGANDTVDGQGGSMNQLGLQGDYSGANAVTFGADQIHNVQLIALLSGADTRFGGGGQSFSYTLTMDDANVAAGAVMTVQANVLRVGEALTFNGAAEHDGSFRIYGGAGDDNMIGGDLGDEMWGNGGSDTFTGRGGADQIHGGAGNDTFVYLAASDSNAAARDHIFDFATGDVIDVAAVGLDHFSNSGAFTHLAGEVIAVYQAGSWTIEGDTNGDGVADLEIQIDAPPNYAWNPADFHLAH